MKVYVVIHGENWEGGRVVAVTRHRTTARLYKRDVMREKFYSHAVEWVVIKEMEIDEGRGDVGKI